MHHTRLVGGLISLAALLTLPLVPGGILADPSAVTSPDGTVPVATSTALPTAAPAPAKPRLSRVQRRERRLRRPRERVVRIARKQLAVPYVYGGAAHGGFDCSGLQRAGADDERRVRRHRGA